MKKSLLLFILAIGITPLFYGQTSNTVTPSDQVNGLRSEESKTLELIAIFNDAIDAPTKYNAYVKPYLQETTFPSKATNSSKEIYNLLLEKWISDNPQKVKKLLADRQKAHDELYGPRKK